MEFKLHPKINYKKKYSISKILTTNIFVVVTEQFHHIRNIFNLTINSDDYTDSIANERYAVCVTKRTM